MSTFILVQEGHAEPKGNMEDLERNLSKMGKLQVENLSGRLQIAGLFPDLGFFSPAKRSRQTLDLLVGDGVPKVEVSQLIMPDPRSAEEIIREAGKEATFSEWMRLDTKNVFFRHGMAAAACIKAMIDRHEAQTALIVGHALTMNALAYGLHQGGDPLMMGPCPEYARGFVITERGVSLI